MDVRTYRHKQDLLRSRLINLNGFLAVAMVLTAVSYGGYRLTQAERFFCAQFNSALTVPLEPRHY